MARILVTGGTAGIGQAVVDQLIAEGNSVIATSRHQQTASAQIEWHQLDLSSRASVHQFCQSTLWDTPIDGVFNNAGFGLIAPIESASEEAIREQFEANYFATMTITQRAMAHFRTHQQGVLMVNTSIGGRMAFPYFGYYNATKHALEASYEALWYECLDSAIQIKIIEPGFTQTQFATHGMQTSGEQSPYHQDGLSWLAPPPDKTNPVFSRADATSVILSAIRTTTTTWNGLNMGRLFASSRN
ncbi:SDR family NAD(P)-dependent oxidoreductase [Litorivicinus sp.]|nr:SDR family NAD(P)-dependent oxidoreductase [Litorivicinus sp.]